MKRKGRGSWMVSCCESIRLISTQKKVFGKNKERRHQEPNGPIGKGGSQEIRGKYRELQVAHNTGLLL